MKRRLFTALAAVVLAALLSLALYRFTPVSRQAHGSLTLWYTERDCPSPVMEALLADYRAETRRVVLATAFPDEQALADAFEGGRPDLLFCSQLRAWDLNERERLSAPEGLPPLPESVEGVIPPGFRPVGGRLPVLLYDPAALPAAPESLEALLDQAGEAGTPYLTADSWAALLYEGMLSLGQELHGSLELDVTNKNYVRLYNKLAEAAFSGGLVELSDGPAAVRQGLLPCAAVSSTAAVGQDGEAGAAVSLLPLPQKGERLYAAELMGFALLGERTAEGEAQAFLSWLAIGGRDGALALRAGLAPLTAGAALTAESALERVLLTLTEEGRLRFLDPESDYCQNREALEARLRASLDLLR